MKLYDRYILPRLVHLACSSRPTQRQRQKVIPLAEGTVLEFGLGSGLNIPFYDTSRVDRLIGVEPSAEFRNMARKTADGTGLTIELLDCQAERVPIEDSSVDCVVTTYTLCTIDDTDAALHEAARVLKPSGKLVFCEHGMAPDPSVLKWQRRMNGIWGKFGGRCRLDRDIPALLLRGGFEPDVVETMYLPGWRPATYNFWGTARPTSA